MPQAFNYETAPIEAGTCALIEANAGTGKTWNIERLYVRLVRERGLEPSQILVVTFTDAAAAELSDRIRAMLASASREDPGCIRLRYALASLDEAAICTIHGFCLRVLERSAFSGSVSFDRRLDASSSDIVGDAVRDFASRWESDRKASLPVPLDGLIDYAATRLGRPRTRIVAPSGPGQAECLAALDDFLRDGEHGVAARKERIGAMDYDDLLLDVRRALLGPDGRPDPESRLALELRETYAAALVDEFQDTDPVQYEIFSTAFGRAPSAFYMIGDPKQAIYSFRGADIYAYYRAAEAVPENRRYTLSSNYRSVAGLVSAVNALFGVADSFASAGCAYRPSETPKDAAPKGGVLLFRGEPLDHPFRVVWISGDESGKPVAKSNVGESVAAETVCRISELLSGAYAWQGSGRRVAPGDIAALANRNDDAIGLQNRLRAAGIPSVLYKAASVFSSKESDELLALMAAMLSPNDAMAVKGALRLPWCGYTLAQLAETDAEDESGWFAALRAEWFSHGIAAALSALTRRFRATSRVASLPDCERKLTNFRQLSELLNDAERGNSFRPDALLGWFRQQRASASDSDDASEQRMESDRNAVTIMTVHKSKGLDFPIVFCPYLSFCAFDAPKKSQKNPGGSFSCHDGNGNSERFIYPGKDGAAPERLAFQRETLAEDLRLFYVAVTRAASCCIAFIGNFKAGNSRKGKTAPGYLIAQSRDPQGPASFVENAPVPGAEPPFQDAPIHFDSLNAAELGAREPTRHSPPSGGAALDPAAPMPPPFARDWGILSYSRMAAHDAHAPRPSAEPGDDEAASSEPPEPARDPLPSGIPAGLCLHAIFEKLDYARVAPAWTPSPADAALIDSAAARFGVYPAAAPDLAIRARIAEIISRTLRTPLLDDAPGFALSSLAMDATRREWRFYFRVPKAIDLAPFKAAGLTFDGSSPLRKGFMNGSLDLTFRRGDRWYFADWKSNTLGPPEAYAPAALDAVMTSTNYRFQAAIYSVALHLRLKTTFGAAYSFERNFGGGVYIFIRGAGPGRGAFRFSPSREEVEAWTRIMAGA